RADQPATRRCAWGATTEGNVMCPCASRAVMRALSVGSSRAITLLVVPRSMPRVLRIFMLPRVQGREVGGFIVRDRTGHCQGKTGAGACGEKNLRDSNAKHLPATLGWVSITRSWSLAGSFSSVFVTPSHDVVLVGGGGAGLRAAIAIAETNPGLRIAVVSKVYPMRSHTVSAEGGAAGVIGADDTLDEHAYDTISGGDWLCDQDAVEAFVKEAPQELLRLEHWGCPWSREPDGRIAVRPFGGMKKMRTWFAADKTGF